MNCHHYLPIGKRIIFLQQAISSSYPLPFPSVQFSSGIGQMENTVDEIYVFSFYGKYGHSFGLSGP